MADPDNATIGPPKPSWDEQLREETAEARRDPRSTQELISAALTEPDDDKAWERITLLHYRATREVFDAARALCRSACPIERKLGADILGQLGVPDRVFPRESFAVLARMLPSESDEEALAAICTALGFQELPEAIPLLVPLKGHPTFNVRWSVALALSGWEDPRAVAALIELSEDEDADIRDWATFGLGTQIDLDTPAIRDALAARLDDPDGPTCGEALLGLAKRKDSRVVGPILDALEEIRQPKKMPPKFDIRSDLVFEAAKEVADPRFLPLLLTVRRSGGWRDSELDHAIRRCRGET